MRGRETFARLGGQQICGSSALPATSEDIIGLGDGAEKIALRRSAAFELQPVDLCSDSGSWRFSDPFFPAVFWLDWHDALVAEGVDPEAKVPGRFERGLNLSGGGSNC